VDEVTSGLLALAQKYVWWGDPAHALDHRSTLLCRLMQYGTFEDVRLARKLVGDDAFKRALDEAPPGILDPKSWNYWHLFYKKVPVPPLPVREFPCPSNPS
jgi:hypothetical protein